MLQFQEKLEEGLAVTYGVNKLHHECESEFQKVIVAETVPFGNALFIDGLIQSSDLDEFMYHECLVHPAMLLHPNPKTVFICGGGEGSTAREALRHKTVEKVTMVDIDGKVVDFCRDVLTANKQAFANPKLELIIDDCKVQLEKDNKYDVIIIDLDDPLEGNPCYHLYTTSFYELCKSKLNEGGIVVTQTSGAGPTTFKCVFSPVHNTLKQVFPQVKGYAQHIYSFMDMWSFVMACSTPYPELTPAEVDKRIAERIEGECKFLDGQSYLGIFCLPKFQRVAMENETRVLTPDEKAFWGAQSVEDQMKH